MKKSIPILFLAVLPILLSSSVTQAGCVGVPDLDRSIVWQVFDGLATLLVVPDGSGPHLTEARTPTGDIVDATIHLQILGYCHYEDPVPDFPREDMWLESIGGGLVACRGGTIADENTDAEGYSQWSQPLKAGGWDEGNCRVVINGNWAGNVDGLTLNFNSPDFNGDRVVNLTDVSEFVTGYFGEYDFRFDLHRDGMISLSDIGVLASGYGKACD